MKHNPEAFFYALFLQWRLDIRSKALLIACYLVPLTFFAVMGGIFSTVWPDAKETLIPALTVFGVSMGALIGVPPTLVEIYGSDIRSVYRTNGLPAGLGLLLTDLSAFLHLSVMSVLLCAAAGPLFGAALPSDPVRYFGGLALFTAASLGAASVIGLAVRDPAKTSLVSILVFLPSILLSGILFPDELLPAALRTAGRLLPATWGFELMSAIRFSPAGLLTLLGMLFLAAAACALLLRRRSD